MIVPFVFVFVLLLHQSTAIVSHIPSPNVCEHKSSGSLWADWESPDCPPTAVCVPIKGNRTHGYCSCSLTPEHHKLEGSKCVPSTNGIAIAVCLGFVCVGSLLLMLFATQQLVLAHSRGVLRMNFMFATGAFSIPTLMFLVIHTICNILLYTNVPDSRRFAIWWLRTVSVLLEGVCVLAVLLLFGLSIHGFVVSSQQLHSMDHKLSRRKTLFRTLALDVLLTIVVTPLVIREQWDLAALLWGVFALLCLLLFNSTLRKFMRLSTDDKEQPRIHVGGRCTQVKMILQGIRKLCRGLLIVILMYIVFCVVLVFAWFTGRRNRNSILVGVVYPWVSFGTDICILAGGVFIALFLRTLVNVRLLTAAGSTLTPQVTLSRVDPQSHPKTLPA